MAHILVAEDEVPINELICRNLKLVGHTFHSCVSGLEALHSLNEHSYDLVLLDVMMSGQSGFEVKEQMDQQIPVMFVTAKDSLSDRLHGLGLGADDYIIKPFEILELLARVEAILRRTNKQQRVFEYAGVRVELENRRVYAGTEEVMLTPKEFALLETFIINRNLALSREQLLELVWGYEYEGESRTIDMHVLRLRKKLNWETTIQTVFKLGYRLNTRQ